LSVRLERSSGFRSLDDEAVALPKRASPLPKPPEDVKGDTIELVVPVEFFMKTR
ncbi:MAG: energy transducer TonB, partial [Sphingobium sp.]|nr:energy transducer TonB [Sphingobium sp.]